MRDPPSLIDVLQDGPKRRPGGPKRLPRWPQEAPKRPQEASKRPPRVVSGWAGGDTRSVKNLLKNRALVWDFLAIYYRIAAPA